MAERTDRDFLESMAKCDDLVIHKDNCGHCHHQLLDAEVAREILAAHPEGPIEGGLGMWADQVKIKWEESKYYKLWQEEKTAGRDPHDAFKERGWEA